MKISKLKNNQTRRVLEFFVDNNLETVTITNPQGEMRIKLLDMVCNGRDKDGNEGVAEDIVGKQIYEVMFKHCTDLEISDSDDINEILETPSEVISRIVMELNDIISELQTEGLVSKIMQINAMEKAVLGVALDIKNNKVADEVERLLDIEKQVLTSLGDILQMSETLKTNEALTDAMEIVKAKKDIEVDEKINEEDNTK